jgi:hypothetical protein
VRFFAHLFWKILMLSSVVTSLYLAIWYWFS